MKGLKALCLKGSYCRSHLAQDQASAQGRLLQLNTGIGLIMASRGGQIYFIRPWVNQPRSRAKSCASRNLPKKATFNADVPLYHVKEALFGMNESECHVFALRPLVEHQLRLAHSYGCGLPLNEALATRDCRTLNCKPGWEHTILNIVEICFNGAPQSFQKKALF